MAYPSVTYTFVNATTASASEVNQNFTDLVNGMSDGTKDLNVNALTVAGTATFNGAVNLGNATGDDITATGYFASALIPKTDDTYDLGTAALAWQDGYFDGIVYTDAISQLGTGGISVTGALIPNADDTHDLGTAALAWQDGYFDGTVYTDSISELTSNAGVTFNHNVSTGVKNHSGTTYTIADDNVSSFTPGNAIGFMVITARADSYKSIAAILSYRTSSTNFCFEMSDAGGFVEPYTGQLLGTTGVDNKFNVSTHTDGKIYLENRIGSSVSIHVVTFGA